MSRQVCPVCGQFAGGHFAGCPEDTDEEEQDTPEIEPEPDAEYWRAVNE